MAKVGAKESKEKKWKDKKKKKKNKSEKQMNDYNKNVEKLNPRWAWLPDQVSNTIKYIYVQEGGISKIWRAGPRGCSSAPQYPWLVLAPQEINTTRELGEFIQIPSPSSKRCVFSLEFDDSELGFTVYACIGHTWIHEKDCTLVGPNSSSDEQFRFTNDIACGGKFYALSLQGTLAVLDIEGLPGPQFRATISILPGVKKAIPSTCSSKGFREYLAAVDGEVLLVLLVSRRSMNVVDDVEVFRLDLTIKVGWVKIRSLGDRTMFLGRKYCSHFSASDLIHCEYAKNSIYFNLETGAGWWVFDVGNGSICPAQV